MATMYDISTNTNVLLTEAQAAQTLGFSQRTLQAWRLRGDGPAFIKVSARAIRYRHADLSEWTNSLRRTSTSDRGSANG